MNSFAYLSFRGDTVILVVNLLINPARLPEDSIKASNHYNNSIVETI